MVAVESTVVLFKVGDSRVSVLPLPVIFPAKSISFPILAAERLAF